jgi:DNA helicase II / ATP-dependent DNA helicase PcrA
MMAKDWLLDLHRVNGAEWKDFAVLFRYHDYQYAIALALDAEMIPHTPVNGFRLFRSKPGRDIYAYLTVILHPNDARPEDFSRILKRPNKYIQNDIINQITNWDAFQNLPDHFQEQWRIENITAFLNKIYTIQNDIENYTAESIVSAIFEEFDFREFYHNIHDVDVDLDKAPDEVLLDLIISVAKFSNSVDDFYMNIHHAIHDNDPIINDNIEEDPNLVALSSIHTSKGREFKNVIYFNHIKSTFDQNETDVEEERRVSYVGITRAIDNILITSTIDNYSIFIKEATTKR